MFTTSNKHRIKMITLKTISQASLQEIFDQAAKHLLTQNEKSQDIINGILTCVYRQSNELKCAVGVFIADDEYSLEMERVAIESSRFDRFFINANNQRFFLDNLQEIHDNRLVKEWKGALINLAQGNSLDYSVVTNFNQLINEKSSN